MSKRYNEPITVLGGDEDPRSFIWRGRSYRVCRILQMWREKRVLRQATEDKTHIMVEAVCKEQAGIYELCFERAGGNWFMTKVVD